jgi:hypothetical protein
MQLTGWQVVAIAALVGRLQDAVAGEWISDEAVDLAVRWSGGLPCQFLQLIVLAASQALTDGTRVEEETLLRAAYRLIDGWQYQLGPSDLDELEADDSLRPAAARARLLRLGALVERGEPDGTLGLGVNPLVGVLLKRRRRPGAETQAAR